MFRAHGDCPVMKGDHFDVSYNRPEEWPNMTPGGTIKAMIFDIGDEEAGPNIQLGVHAHNDAEVLDWKHSIDPLHHHGSDQFRMIFEGAWIVGGRMDTGDYSFQESGMVYQEHPATDDAGILLMMGDRRGTQATLALAKDMDTMFEYGEVYGKPMPGKPYPHPAGDWGIIAIASDKAELERGFIRGHRGDAPMTGVLGDPVAGPTVHVARFGPGETVLPPCTTATELLLGVSGGSCTIGDDAYVAAELRVQRGGAPLSAVIAGPDGAEVLLVVADRRAPLDFGVAATPAWLGDVAQVTGKLAPRPGGVRKRAEACAV